MTAPPRFQAALGLALLGLLLLPIGAAAHAELVASDPEDGATIALPYMFSAEFDDELGPEQSRIVVRDEAGNEVARGGVSAEDARVMTVELAALAPGEYVARWTAVTPDDSGVTRGNIGFTVAAPATPSPTPSAEPTPSMGSTGSPLPTAPASPTASPNPSPTPGTDGAAGSTTDLLIAVAIAGLLVGGLLFVLLRRRSA